jgi:hypothetical protein
MKFIPILYPLFYNYFLTCLDNWLICNLTIN